jgi:hypothetical protein
MDPIILDPISSKIRLIVGLRNSIGIISTEINRLVRYVFNSDFIEGL